MDMRTVSTVKAEINEVEPYNAPRESSSPGLHGSNSPGSKNKLAGETFELHRTSNSHSAHKGSAVTRKDE
jgi:hypothetical protein